eukprot:1194835-Prorocentrum_minimum.AAC.6
MGGNSPLMGGNSPLMGGNSPLMGREFTADGWDFTADGREFTWLSAISAARPTGRRQTEKSMDPISAEVSPSPYRAVRLGAATIWKPPTAPSVAAAAAYGVANLESSRGGSCAGKAGA